VNLFVYLQSRSSINAIATSGALLAITLLALFLRLHLLGQDSFWGDELASVRRAQMDWDAFWELMRGTPAMALYYALLRFWILLGERVYGQNPLRYTRCSYSAIGLFYGKAPL
jgi:hypothetical protein